ncbi:hypothetical protein [Bernardetia sp. MNP-M8]|uniref:hypothetical protein n=1 Tax=Bernardetia sp. MNP-M8 TaxID=3127470 RepID=UPI0030D08A7B
MNKEKISAIVKFVLKDKFFYVIFFVAFLMYVYLLHPALAGKNFTDIKPHAGFAKLWIEQGLSHAPLNFLYFGTIIVLGGFYANLQWLGFVSAIVLSLSWAAKYSISKWVIEDYLVIYNIDTKVFDKYITYLAIGICFVGHIPFNTILNRNHLNFYMGELSPNTWHNSTTTFMLPFCVLLFYLAYKKVFLNRKGLNTLIIILAVTCFFVKPNFTLCFSPIYFCCIFYKYKLTKNFWLALPACIIPFVLLLVHSIILFHSTYGGDYAQANQPSIIFSPFSVWQLQLGNPILAPILSFFSVAILPILYLIFYKKRSSIVYLSLIFSILALIIFILFAEVHNGSIAPSGNFIWQVTMCNYIMFLVFGIESMKRTLTEPLDFKKIIIWFLIALHSMSGVMYMGRILVSKYYF